VKLFAFSDIQLDEYALHEVKNKDCDLMVCAGNLSKYGSGLREMIEFLSSIKKEILFIPGNNDPIRQSQELCQEFGLTFIHSTSVERNGFTFAGIGRGLISNLNTPFEMKKILSKFKGLKNLILVSHAPPKGLLGELEPGFNIGSESVLEFIKKEQPLLCLCGHAGKELMIGNTRVISLGKHGKTIKLLQKT